MGGKNKAAGLTLCFVASLAVWGSASVAAAVANDWRAKVSAQLLAIYDSPAAGESVTPELRKTIRSDVSALDPHFNADGRVQVDVHYDCSRRVPVSELVAAGLSVSSSVKLATLCV